MPLVAYNLTGAPVVLITGKSSPPTLPASTSPPSRGPAFNITSEFRPNLTVDPANGITGGLGVADFAALKVQVDAGTVAIEWTADPEYLTALFDPSGPLDRALEEEAVENSLGDALLESEIDKLRRHQYDLDRKVNCRIDVTESNHDKLNTSVLADQVAAGEVEYVQARAANENLEMADLQDAVARLKRENYQLKTEMTCRINVVEDDRIRNAAIAGDLELVIVGAANENVTAASLNAGPVTLTETFQLRLKSSREPVKMFPALLTIVPTENVADAGVLPPSVINVTVVVQETGILTVTIKTDTGGTYVAAEDFGYPVPISALGSVFSVLTDPTKQYDVT